MKKPKSIAWLIYGIIILFSINYTYLTIKEDSTMSFSTYAVFLVSLSLTFLISAFLSERITHYPNPEATEQIIIITSIIYLILMVLIVYIRPFYSRVPILISYVFSLAWLLSSYYIYYYKNKITLALVPAGNYLIEPKRTHINIVTLTEPTTQHYDGIIVDLDTTLSPQWSEFITRSRLNLTPIYSVKYIVETISGQVNLKSNNINFTNQNVSNIYLPIKRSMDLFIVIVTLPLSLLIILLAIIAIKIETPGSPFFIQKRTGKGGKVFKIYKLRSMNNNKQTVTKVGKYIRKVRIDELPQILNILKNQMSLIGPRPENIQTDDKFRKNIAYYDYRYLAKPGITGWAQINLGHVTSEKDTQKKLEMDVYYVKNISLWLDLHIMLKTLKVIGLGYK